MPNGITALLRITWPFSSRNRSGRNLSGFSNNLGSWWHSQTFIKHIAPFGMRYPQISTSYMHSRVTIGIMQLIRWTSWINASIYGSLDRIEIVGVALLPNCSWISSKMRCWTCGCLQSIKIPQYKVPDVVSVPAWNKCWTAIVNWSTKKDVLLTDCNLYKVQPSVVCEKNVKIILFFKF